MSYGTIQIEKMTTESGYSLGAGNASSFKNRFINPGMVIDQRNAGASVAVTGNTGQMSCDRWELTVYGSGTGRFSGQQSSVAPTGFVNSLLLTVTTADAAPSSAYAYGMGQTFEGYNTADLGWGTANAKQVTLSFWVRSSVTGTFPIVFNAFALDQFYGATYTISSANTWEFKTITISGPTSGTFNTTNSGSFNIKWGLGGGSGRTISAGSWTTTNAGSTQLNVTGCTQLIATNGATLYMTGAQLEVGTVATSFDFRSYGTELALCQRYYQRTFQYGSAFGLNNANNATWYGHGKCHVTMRDVPTASIISGVTPVVDMMLAGTKTWSSGTPIGKTVNSWKWDFAFSGGTLGTYYIGVLANDCIECSAEL